MNPVLQDIDVVMECEVLNKELEEAYRDLSDLNLELDVLDTDATGTNSWTVVVTAAGS